MVLDFGGPRIHVHYIDEDGGEHQREKLTLAERLLELWKKPPHEGVALIARQTSQWLQRDPIIAKAVKHLLEAGAPGLASQLLDDLAMRADPRSRKRGSKMSQDDESLR